MRVWKSTLLVVLALGLVGSAYAQDVSVGKKIVPQAPTVAKSAHSPAFGLNGDHYVRIGGSEFVTDGVANSCYTNTWAPPASTSWTGYFSSLSCWPHLYAWVHAPGGSLIDYVEFDFCDTNATYDLVGNVYACDWTGACNSTPVITVSSNGTSGCNAWTANPGISPVGNYLSEYLLEIVFPSPGATDGTLAQAGAIVGWKYQVSPAPGSATFGDVPTTDAAFQFIEALAASGITTGCGGGNYCPDNPLTRRQMAVFLSKALGLYWGGY